jgi:predicted glutamine amidotransferase
MCIAVAKPIGVDIPSDEILTNCFKNNPDGAGFAFNYNNEVIIRKGYMKLKDFLDAFHKYDKKFNFKNRGVLIHTRITTHGGTNPQMCHPFPICSDEGALKKIEYTSPYAVIHNGIISLTSAEATQKKDMSDTAVFIQRYLTKIAMNKNWLYKKENIELIEDLIGSKMAILNEKGKIFMTNGFTEDNGIFYSNSTYQDNSTRWMKYYDWDWDEDLFSDLYSKDYKNYLTAQGYEQKEDGKWEKSKTQKVKSYDSEDYLPLMILNPREMVVYEDTTTDDYVDDVLFFTDKENNIYITFDTSEREEKEIISPLEYCGLGLFYDSATLKPIEFKPTHYTSIYNNGDYYDDYADGYYDVYND